MLWLEIAPLNALISKILKGKPGNFPTFDSLPGFDGATYEEPKPYEAQASYESPKTVPPTINR